ncbi:AMP-binding protein [Armatimonas sp.]|uniref:AMP-binding protein n=1 Tax=Armatimonas sp. TaxID=1872638 RepID=UPI0037507E10
MYVKYVGLCLSDSGALSYAAVEKLTNQWAHALQSRGIRHGDRVTLVLPRGIETILAMALRPERRGTNRVGAGANLDGRAQLAPPPAGAL